MPASSLLTLLDDIASLLDDVAVLSKVAVKKTSGVLGDDLALNAEKVTGVSSDREIPVVWKVAKGSFVNKLVLVPGALLISSFAPVLIFPLLFLGGAFLCYEGFEKIWEKWTHWRERSSHNRPNQNLHSPTLDSEAIESNTETNLTESEKINGAIRTDFILSLEIIVIALGSMEGAVFLTQLMVLSLIGIGMTIGVYGLVVLIVKIDDLGFLLLRKKSSASQSLGNFFLKMAPVLMKFLGIAGTTAMFLVGGGIISHAIPFLHHASESMGGFSFVLDGLVGVMAGALIVGFLAVLKKGMNKNFDDTISSGGKSPSQGKEV